MFASRLRKLGVSIIEVLITLTILALILVPIIQIFSSSHRMGSSARRLVDVVVHVQSLVEAVSELDDQDFPPLTTGQETVLMDDDGRAGSGPSPKYQEICTFFAQQKPKNFEDMKRALLAKRLATGEVEVRVEVTWLGVIGEERTRQKLVLPMLATPRNWQ